MYTPSLRSKWESLYGVLGADLKEAVRDVGIATDNRNAIFHIHFRGNPRVGDEVLEIVAKMTDLMELVANGTAITDEGLVRLKHLKKLSLLHLAGTKITDLGLGHLKDLPLEMLDVGHTFVTKAGIESLRCLVPTLKDLHY